MDGSRRASMLSNVGNGSGSRRKSAISSMVSSPTTTVPVLANFEEWMKMATDNKINVTNTWNFALIDYFHDMSLLREGNGINFQKASCTLDGCVKIYSSRIDAVASETGKLLSGLMDGRNQNEEKQTSSERVNDDDDDEPSQKRSKAHRSECTLAKSFANIQNKKLDLDFSVDPLFKKASADFDEGGAKGLLMNYLSIDARGRVIFDANEEEEDSGEEPQAEDESPINDNLNNLIAKCGPILQGLESTEICPAISNGALEGPFLEIPIVEQSPGAANDFGDKTNLPYGDDMPEHPDDYDEGSYFETVPFEGENSDYMNGSVDKANMDERIDTSNGVTEIHSEHTKNIIALLNGKESSTWAGPEHWKVQRLKKDNAVISHPVTRARISKEPLEIDFLKAAMEFSPEEYFVAGTSITMPKLQQVTSTLLPEDHHYSNREMLSLFLKPNVLIGKASMSIPNLGQESQQENNDDDGEEAIDRQFFEDNGIDGVMPFEEDDDKIGLADNGFIAPTMMSNSNDQAAPLEYARSAKKVDIKLLKDNMWKVLETKDKDTDLSSTVSKLVPMYDSSSLKDISTSYCFICLLHLANEEGLEIQNTDNYMDLRILQPA